MAKDVDAASRTIIQVNGAMSEDGASTYLEMMKAAKRYLRDVY